MQFDVEVHFYIYGLRDRAINIIAEEFEDENDTNSASTDFDL